MKLEKNLIIGILFKMLLLSCITYSVIEIIATGLGLYYDNGSVIISIIVLISVLTVIRLFNIRLMSLLSCALLLLFYVSIVGIYQVTLGFQSVADQIIYFLKSFYNIELVSYGVKSTVQGVTTFFTFAAFILLGLNYISIQWLKKSGLTFLPGGLALIVVLLLGSRPSTPALFLYMTSGLVMCTAYQKNKKVDLQNHVVILMSALVIAALFISAVLIYPVIQPSEEALESVKHDLLDIYKSKNVYFYVGDDSQNSSSSATGGISKGNLDDIGSISYSNTKHLEVTVGEKPDNAIYLKGYVAVAYVNNHWEELDYTSLYQLAGEYGFTEQEAGMEAQNITLNRFHEYLTIGTMNIQYFGKNNVIYPYAALLESDYTYSGDSNIIQSDWTGDTFNYYPEFYDLLNGNIGNWVYNEYNSEDNAGSTNARATEFFSLYRDYILNEPEYYAHNPTSDGWTEIEQYLSEDVLEGESMSIIIQAVRNYLKETAVYDLNPGQVPSGEDFVDYFLFENHKGFCMHFASAATLIFRYCGIPSRYVEGYVVTPGDFEENEDGTYTAIVKDNRAHAWTEIFNSTYGWIPVEVTPSYLDGNIPSENQDSDSAISAQTQEDSKDTSSTTTAPQNDSVKENENKEDTHENSVNTKENKKAIDTSKIIDKWVINVVIVIIVIIVLIIIIIIRRYIIVRNRSKKIFDKDYREGVLNCYNEILKLLEICGFTYHEELSEEVNAIAVEADYNLFDKGEYKLFTQLVLKAVYSQHDLAQDERNQSVKLYKKIRKKIYIQLKSAQKLWFVWVKCL